MYYKCDNSKCNGMLALIRFSYTFYLVFQKHFSISRIMPPPKPPYKVIKTQAVSSKTYAMYVGIKSKFP